MVVAAGRVGRSQHSACVGRQLRGGNSGPEAAEKNAVLTALRKEFVEQREALDEDLVYERASRDNARLSALPWYAAGAL